MAKRQRYDISKVKFDGEHGKIHLGIPRERVLIPAFVDNRDMILYNLAHLNRDAGYFQAEGHRVDRNRDRIVLEFLEHKDKPEWLLMLDSDMDHPPDIPVRLTRWNKPVVGGLYFHRGESHDPFVFREAPRKKDQYGRSILKWAPLRDEVWDFLEKNQVPLKDGSITIDQPLSEPLIECDAVATGALLIHRSVLEFMPKPIFEYRKHSISEDLMFCYEAKRLGIPIYADLSCISGHYNWVAMGQTQFRMLYKARGLNLTSYSKSQAITMYSEYMGVPKETAQELIERGNAHMVGDYWNSKKPSTPEEVAAFYAEPHTGKLYLMELLHWNFGQNFDTLRRPLMDVRDAVVMEIGAGIGTVSMQMAVQNNKVTAIEPNETLRGFIDYRWHWLSNQMAGRHGDITTTSKEAWREAPDESQDVVIALDVFEHIPKEILKEMLRHIYRILKPGGTLFYHANWYQQDLYPMHFDFSEEWPQWLTELGFLQTGGLTAVKV